MYDFLGLLIVHASIWISRSMIDSVVIDHDPMIYRS